MKRSFRFYLLIGLLILSLSFLVACSSNKSHDLTIIENSKTGTMDSGKGETGPSPGDIEEDFAEDSKIITSIYLSFETTEFDKTSEKINQLLSKYKAYMEDSNISYDSFYNGKYYKYGEFVIRVPKGSLLDFKSELKGVGLLTSESTRKEDVTKLYKDTESRLKVIKTKEDRVLSLLEKADKMEDIIQLENQLSDIIYEKEKLQSELIDVDDRVDYSSVTIDIREVEKLSNQETSKTSFGNRIKNAFDNSLYGFGQGLQDFVIWLIYALPLILLLAILGFIIFIVSKRIIRNKNSKS